MSEQKSLAALQGLVPANVPSLLQGGPIAETNVVERAITPYVIFGHPMSKVWPKIAAAYPNAAEAEQFLISSDGVLRVTPLKYHLLKVKQYWGQGDQEALNAVSFSYRNERGWGENIEAVILAYHGDRLIPATMQFRTVKAGAVHPMIKAVEEASQPDWSKKSKAHELTLQCQQPWMRCVGVVKVGKQRTAKGSGYKYTPAEVSVTPTGLEEWTILAKHMTGKDKTSQDFYKAVEIADETYTRRINELHTIAARSK